MLDCNYNVPKWAALIAEDVLAIVPLVELRWRRTKHQRSSGWASLAVEDNVPIISVSAGTSRRDAKWVLLHECAHVLLDEGHSLRFWKLLHTLVPMYGIPIEYSVWRSGHRNSLRAADQLGHPRLAARVHSIKLRDDSNVECDVRLFRSEMAGIKVTPRQASQEARFTLPMTNVSPQKIQK